MRVEIADTTR